MGLNLPKTQVRLRSSITIRAIPDPRVLDNLGAGKTSLYGLYAISLKYDPLGEIKSFSRDQTREVYRRYSIGKYSHEPFQVVPLKVTTNLTIVRAILYKNDMLKTVFGFWGESLLMQQMPFVIVENKNSPTGDILETAVIFYNDCWFTSNPIEYDIDAEDQWIIQDREISCGSITVFDSTIHGAAALASETLSIAGEIYGTKGVNLLKDLKIY